MVRWPAGYAATLVALACLDGAYLSTIGGRLFKSTLGDVMATSFPVTPIVLFYGLYPIGVLIFGATGGGEPRGWQAALLYGALFGFFVYATYDLTNWATIRNWTPALVAVDVAWGTTLGALVSLAGATVLRWMDGGG